MNNTDNAYVDDIHNIKLFPDFYNLRKLKNVFLCKICIYGKAILDISPHLRPLKSCRSSYR